MSPTTEQGRRTVTRFETPKYFESRANSKIKGQESEKYLKTEGSI